MKAILICAVLFFATSITVFAERGVLPTIHINTTTGISPLYEREIWQAGTITYGNPATGEVLMPTAMQTRGRGNATWLMGADKRPIRFRLDEAQPILGSGHAATDWILLANRFDRSLLRNYAALHLATELSGMSFVPFFQNVHLHVNGTYMGVYLLTDERDTTPGRLEISHHEDPAKSDFFFELDNRAPETGTENETFVVANHLPYAIRYPGSRRRTPEHVTYLREYLEATSYAIRFGTFDEILELIDLESFVDFYIVQEFFKNRDAYKLSIFMHITGEGDERRLFMGPVWDFDISAGNSVDDWFGTAPEGLYVAILNYWYRNLMERQEFFAAVSERWTQIRNEQIAQTISQVRETATRYRFEFERDFERHPVANSFTRREFRNNHNFMWHTEYLANWMEARANWLDKFFAGELPDYCHMWELVEYYMYETRVGLTVRGVEQALQTPIIRLPYATKIALAEAERIFDLEVTRTADTISMRIEGTTITHQIARNNFTKNGEAIYSAVPSIVIQNHVFLPLRTIAEALGYTVDWLNESKTVVLNIR